MKRNILNKGIVLLLVFSAFGCRTRKPIAPVVVAPAPTTEARAAFNKAEVLRNISAKQINFNTLLLKAKADLSINNNTNGVSMNIRMQRDKAIWISVSVQVLGEVARTLITPDSIKIINKLESTYTRKPFSYIYQFTNKQIDFRTLQDIFIGNPLAGTLSLTSKVDVNGGRSQVSGDLSGLAYQLLFSTANNLLQSNITDTATSQALTISYGQYKAVGGQEIPHAISIKSGAAKKSINLDMQYTHVGLNEPVDFPFSVPKRFTVKD